MAKDKLHRREALETRIKSMEERVFRLEERVSVQLRSFREGLAAASEDAQRDRLALQVGDAIAMHLCSTVTRVRAVPRTCKAGWRKI